MLVHIVLSGVSTAQVVSRTMKGVKSLLEQGTVQHSPIRIDYGGWHTLRGRLKGTRS